MFKKFCHTFPKSLTLLFSLIPFFLLIFFSFFNLFFNCCWKLVKKPFNRVSSAFKANPKDKTTTSNTILIASERRSIIYTFRLTDLILAISLRNFSIICFWTSNSLRETKSNVSQTWRFISLQSQHDFNNLLIPNNDFFCIKLN